MGHCFVAGSLGAGFALAALGLRLRTRAALAWAGALHGLAVLAVMSLAALPALARLLDLGRPLAAPARGAVRAGRRDPERLTIARHHVMKLVKSAIKYQHSSLNRPHRSDRLPAVVNRAHRTLSIAGGAAMDGNSAQSASVNATARTLGTAISTLRALDVIAGQPRGVPAKVLAHRLEISLSSAYSLINSLRTEGFVEVSPVGSGLFTLGPKVLRLYKGYVEASTQPERFEPFVDELRDRARARAYVALWKDGDVEVAQIRGRRGARMLHDVTRGFRGAAHALALGKVYLASLGEEHWPTYLRRPILQRFSRNTITSRQALHAHLPKVRRGQIAFDVEEYEAGSCCVAAPLHDATGRLVATLGLSVSAQRFRHDRNALVAIVKDVSRKAEAELASKQGLDRHRVGALWVPGAGHPTSTR